MEKECLICNKKYKTYNKNSKFCGKECQYESYRKTKVDRMLCNCLNCGIEFKVKENDIKLGRGKYCSRECKDNQQKKTYKGENNPMFGKKMSEKTRKIKSKITKKLWENPEYRRKIRESIINFQNKKGYWPGCDDTSKNKRKITLLKKYGVSHIWEGVYGERSCDKTTIEKYGKSSAEILIDYEFKYGRQTDIEIMFKNLLDKLKIEYQYKFRIYTKNKKPFWFREFDFLINNTKILIEVDGDFWHGNNNVIGELSEFQIENQKKDRVKEKFAKDNGYEVIRFWGSEIKNNIEKIERVLLNKLNKNE